MKVPILSIEDFSPNEANCGNCTRKGGYCIRSKSNKQLHNGYLFGFSGDIVGVIYKCQYYTGIVRTLFN